MFFHFCDVVRDVVNDVHVQVIWSAVKRLRKSLLQHTYAVKSVLLPWELIAVLMTYSWAYLSCEEGHAGTIDPGIVCSRRHCFEVVLSLSGGDACTGQLSVVHSEVVSLHGLLHLHKGIWGGKKEDG